MPKSLPRTQALSTSTRSAKKQGRRRDRLAIEALDRRCMLSGTPTTAGVDALALGDVNGDQVADIAVASHDATGNNYVTIYSGAGKENPTMTSGFAALELVKITNPLGASSGPLDIALGDFSGTGVSQLAIASTNAPSGQAKVGLWSFQNKNPAASPVNSLVDSTITDAPFTPTGMGTATGFHIAAADLLGRERDQLLIAPGGSPTGSFTVAVFHPKPKNDHWTYQAVGIPSGHNLTQGASISAGYVTGDNNVDVVIGSKSDGKVSLYDGASKTWVSYGAPLDTSVSDFRVAAVSNINAPGSVVVTEVAGDAPWAKVIPYNGIVGSPFTPAKSPGAGALVPLGAGYVYQRSTITGSGAFKTSDGPVTPTVIFGATSASQLIVQGFDSNTTSPSKVDVKEERLANVKTKGFVPLQVVHDHSATGEQSKTTPKPDDGPTNLIVYPKINYSSPYSVHLTPISNAPPVTQGLGVMPFVSPSNPPGPWGPDKQANKTPAGLSNLVPSDAGDWLRERVVASLTTYIGADYQHHYDPRWQPEQGSKWNIAGSVAYQSQGIDCTNLTAFVYADAMGISMTSATQAQADITPANQADIDIPNLMKPYVQLQTISAYIDPYDKAKGRKTYEEFTKQLLPGDILYINGNTKEPWKATHGITWLGQYGVDAETGLTVPLVIDATGINPQHTDQNHMVVPQGVHIRPFGAPVSENSWEYPNYWYFQNVDHALRIIK